MTRPNKFWIIGGEYADTRFDRPIDGTTSQLAAATTSNAHQRYTIAHEGAR